MNTVKTSKFSLPTPEIQRKLELCVKEAAGLTLRDVRCPFCNFLVSRVFSDVGGHYLAKCQKCKKESILNFAYFRRQRGIRRLREKYSE